MNKNYIEKRKKVKRWLQWKMMKNYIEIKKLKKTKQESLNLFEFLTLFFACHSENKKKQATDASDTAVPAKKRARAVVTPPSDAFPRPSTSHVIQITISIK